MRTLHRIYLATHLLAWGFALILSRLVARKREADAPKLAAAADGRGN